MSADFSSSNPFRRKGPAAQSQPTSNPSYQPQPLPIHLETQSLNPPKKITKKVRVQSPPPLSPDLDSASTIGEERYPISARLPSPIPQDNDPFNATVSDTSEDEVVARPKGVPANPFAKTLETLERTERVETSAEPIPTTAGPGKASLDVEAFKRLLMTGNSGLEPTVPVPAATQAPVAHHILTSGDSSTDTSSLSRQSIFEATQEPHPETPRTSHELEEPDEYRRVLAPTGRKKPPPPSSRHGKLIKVELRDDPPLQTPPPGSGTSLQFSPSLTDLNKPLPPAPRRASHESDRESIFDKEAAGKTPEPPSPSSSLRPKQPPAPPLARRHSQKVSSSKLSRTESGRLSPKVEEDSSGTESLRPRSNSGRSRSDSFKIPPPPPSRRPGTARASSTSQTLASQPSPALAAITSPSSVSLPPAPPQRATSRSISGSRPPSVMSMELSSTPVKRASMPPPPPPPHRHRRGNSFETQSPPNTSRRTSGDYSRKSLDSIRRESIDIPEADESGIGGDSRPDILADLSKLQREIDELRIQGERRVS